MSAAIRRACSKLVAVPNRGAGSPAVFSTSPNSPRSSARSIAFGLVPTIGTPASASRCGQAQRRLPAELHDDADDAGTACPEADSAW